MAEVHGNRTHLPPSSCGTPDLKSGSPTSELSTSVNRNIKYPVGIVKPRFFPKKRFLCAKISLSYSKIALYENWISLHIFSVYPGPHGGIYGPALSFDASRVRVW